MGSIMVNVSGFTQSQTNWEYWYTQVKVRQGIINYYYEHIDSILSFNCEKEYTQPKKVN